MPKVQRRSVSPFNDESKDFAEVIQSNIEDLFEDAHDHGIRTTVPGDDEGSVGDIIGVEISGVFSVYFKFSSGWKSATLT